MAPGKTLAVDVEENNEHIAVSIDIEVPVQAFSSKKSEKNMII